ncbi:MAG: histidine phosphatase family protein [Candidatus Bathyarchaeota archaeon]|nr:MAG: histidine phosphatase family protein [Candidatus Bathyarchaeota archaeon]
MNPIVLIRHGQAEHNLGGLTGGWSQTSLTDLGRRQVKVLAERLREELAEAPCALYFSDLRRAAQTAEIIAEETGLTPIPAPDLREFNNGIAADKTKAEAEPYFTPPTRPLLDWRPYPEAETWREFYHRVAGCMDRLHQGQDRPIIIVTHGGTIVNVISWWLRLPLETLSDVSFHASPASITVLNETELRERAIERLNDFAHLRSLGLAPRLSLA